MAYNEEDRIGDALESLSFCTEHVVVDSHSNDRTREVACRHGARVIERDWPGHIEQMNFLVDQAQSDWVLCVDADERVTTEMRRSVIEALSSDHPADGYWVNRRNIYLGRWVRHGGWYPDRKIRLFRRSCGRFGGVNPHPVVRMAPETRTSSLHGDLEHLPYRSLEAHIETVNYYTTITAGEMVLQAKSGFRLRQLLAPPGRFVKMFVLQLGFLDGWRGFLLAAIGAFDELLRHAKAAMLARSLDRGDLEQPRLRYGRPDDPPALRLESEMRTSRRDP
jgi:glycosyltransferase involved in cell wall biosynthesis